MADVTGHRFLASASSGEVSALLCRPQNARALFVYAHGAGAGMNHAFLENTSRLLAERGIATFRYQFPYTEQGGRRPDPAPRMLATVRSAVTAAASLADGLPLFAGGKSMGGRMTSQAQAAEPLPGVLGLAFMGFPLHGAGKPLSTQRAAHLAEVHVPMLFLRGARDSLADPDLMRSVTGSLGTRATLHLVEHADHGFHVLKRSGRTGDDVLEELVGTLADWIDGQL
jgi:hypothetical protein